eukprot:364889-Chlamydomonas_euryale.AAC.2
MGAHTSLPARICGSWRRALVALALLAALDPPPPTSVRSAGSRKVYWQNLREEPLIYINGAPFVVREADQPFSNLEYTGVRLHGVRGMVRAVRCGRRGAGGAVWVARRWRRGVGGAVLAARCWCAVLVGTPAGRGGPKRSKERCW